MIGSLGHAMDDLWANPVRNILAIFSVFIGVVAVVAIVALSSAISELKIAEAEQTSGREVTYYAQMESDGEFTTDEVKEYVALADAGFNGTPVVLTSTWDLMWTNRTESPFFSGFSKVSFTAVAGDLGGIRRIPFLAGKAIDSDATGPLQLLVNRAGSEVVGPLGSHITVALERGKQPMSAVIVGVIADGAQDAKMYGDLVNLKNTSPEPFGVDAIYNLYVQSQVLDPELVLEVVTRTENSTDLKSSGMTPRRVDKIGEIKEDLVEQKAGFMIAGLIALVVSSIGILNIGLASVRERSRELVVRRAIGAKRSQLVAQVLLHAIGLAVFATLLAVIAVVVAILYIVPSQVSPDSPIAMPSIPWNAFGLGLGAAVATTLVGSLIPAVIASRLTISDALRA